jgi:hypothetical protein
VKLVMEIDASATGDTGFALDSIDAAFAYRDGVTWRQCGTTGPIDPGPNDEGKYCGGVQNRGCKTGLSCEYAENAYEGTCVDPNESVPAQPKHERCGGYRDIPCQSGLVCRWIRAASQPEQKLGLCTPPTGQENDICGGHPNVPCASGLTCYATSSTCVKADGAFKSRCGEGLTPCQSGLYCNGTYCAYPSVGAGEECGGPREIGCKYPLKCRKATPNAETGICGS